MSIKEAFTLLAPFFLIMSCTTKQPVRPPEAYTELFEERLSVINIPVEVSLRDLERSLNEQLEGVVYNDQDINDGDNMRIKVEKRRHIRLGIDSQLIKYRVPLLLWIQYDLGFSKVEAEGELSIDFATAFSISEDWNITTETEVLQYDWLSKPRLKMGVVSLPVGFIAGLVLENSKTALTRSIDELVQQQFNLREMADETWKNLFEPLLVSEDYHTWISINPRVIGMTPLDMKGDRIRGAIFVESQPRASVGKQPEKATAPPLPSLQLRPETGDDFTIHLKTAISYEEAERIAKTELVGESFSKGKRSVTVEDVELYGQGNHIVINTTLSGSYNGSIYLIGEPEYNFKKNTIEIRKLDYELSTRNFLLKSAGWLLKSTMKNQIEKNMNFLLDYNLTEMRSQFQEQLAEYQVTESVLLRGELAEVAIHNAYLAPDAIIVDLVLNGRLNINVKGLN